MRGTHRRRGTGGQTRDLNEPADIHVASCWSSLDISKVTEHWHESRKDLIREIRLGSFLDMADHNQQDRYHGAWCLTRVNVENRTMFVSDTLEAKITTDDVEQIMGVPKGGHRILHLGRKASVPVPKKVREILDLGGSTNKVQCSKLRTILMEELPEEMTPKQKSATKVAFTLYVGARMIATVDKLPQVPAELLNVVAEPDLIGTYDFNQYILDMTFAAAEVVQETLTRDVKTILMIGCPLFVQVFYADWKEYGYPFLNRAIMPRMNAYNTEMVEKACEGWWAKTSELLRTADPDCQLSIEGDRTCAVAVRLYYNTILQYN